MVRKKMRHKSEQTFLHRQNESEQLIYNIAGYIAVILAACGGLILLAQYIAGVSF